MDKNKQTEKLGVSRTEAWADTDHSEKGSRITIPSEVAVEDAKRWVEENEK